MILMKQKEATYFILIIYLFEYSLFKQQHSLSAVRSYNNKSKHKKKYKILYKVHNIRKKYSHNLEITGNRITTHKYNITVHTKPKVLHLAIFSLQYW